MLKTIQESIAQLHGSLREYIEATYHIGDPWLIEQRHHLLDEIGVIHQTPYLESTPRYTPGPKFRDIPGLPPAALAVFEALSASEGEPDRLLYNPPYSHQAASICESLVNGRNLIITTGTGSGKTECFLLPILGKIAKEAQETPRGFDRAAVRAFLLYPMNALVNDQLGRLRAVFGDPRLARLFRKWAGRLPRFARYTSRTPYAGVRDPKKDARKLKSLDDFYIEIERAAEGPESEEHTSARRVRDQLRLHGKWPAKPNMQAWFGEKGSAWRDRHTGEFIRAVTLPADVELLTRHEVQAAPPDLLVTNYSMLEYMLMRPIERPIFEQTRLWLAANSKERVLIVLDEAHLYRGSAGAEVGLLLRRLRERLDIGAERLQIICATASFEAQAYAATFGAQLSGAPAESFASISGTLDLRRGEGSGEEADAAALAAVDLNTFYQAEREQDQTVAVGAFLDHRGSRAGDGVEARLYHALKDFPPLSRLVNMTMGKARPVAGMGADLFPGVSQGLADAAVTALLALGSRARLNPKAPGLLPCRAHTFFRGLPGLWVCMDPDCTEIPPERRGGICGRLYGQPRQRCDCGACVLEFYTCRNCGGCYARAYTDDVDDPSALWSEPGRAVRMPSGPANELLPLDLLLEVPHGADAGEEADYDLETGRLNAPILGPRTRRVYLRPQRAAPPVDEDGRPAPNDESRGQFTPCGLCGQRAAFNRSSVQDHLTKGDQPFQTLLSRQIHVQPPGPPTDIRFAPLRGRKVLVFSDSRQVAARLAPNLQMYSVRDSLRPLLIWGFKRLQQNVLIASRLNLDDAYFGVLLAAKALGVRLRPELKSGETFAADVAVEAAVDAGALTDDSALFDAWMENRAERSPQALLEEMVNTINDRFLGLEALGLASVIERPGKTEVLRRLPPVPGLAETPEAKLGVVRAWIRCWQRPGIWFAGTPHAWWGNVVSGHSGKFKAMDRLLTDRTTRKVFADHWLPELRRQLTDDSAGAPRLLAKELSLEIDGSWVRCPACKSVHRPIPGFLPCLDCDGGVVEPLDPVADPVFAARKSYYRNGVAAALAIPPEPPMALIAAEHTAQLNAPQNDDAFSKAEEHELLFQDIDMTWRPGAKHAAAIDILSSTTTMEVGIDIGALSGVALRNMPPGRANYQQRAGRAGRRGNAVATVVAFGSADSHDEHYFQQPAEMICGPVVDPRLTLDNPDIVKRHVRAFLLQKYHQDRLPDVDPSDQPDLFSVLGSVAAFRSGRGILNRDDFSAWLKEHAEALRDRARGWIPAELSKDDREALLAGMFEDCLAAVDIAVDYGMADEPGPAQTSAEDQTDEIEADEDPAPDGEDRGERDPCRGMLLDRLLYSGVLPRYAFPTDVATFHVFDRSRSSGFRPIFSFAPSQGLPIALSQYAPGKQVWISGKCYTSGAIYSPSKDERRDAWAGRKLYFECSVCGFADTTGDRTHRGDVLDCPACRSHSTFGPARQWMRPSGFAHPVDIEEETSPDSVPETSYATRAKLTMSTPGDEASWRVVNERLKGLKQRTFLLVSNTGPRREGYSYCTSCGRIEATTEVQPFLGSPHPKPFPTRAGESNCSGGFTARKVVLGTDFITDITLFSMRVDEPMRLKPGWHSTDVALRTLSEALAKAACLMLEIEPGEVLAEYRPGLTSGGQTGLEAEIFLYDTLPGGAGFSSELADRGEELFRRASQLLTDCTANCDSSCYRCLRSFKNKFEHGFLDRHVGAELVGYFLTGQLPAFEPRRIEVSTNVLFNDLSRLADRRVTYERHGAVSISGGGEVDVPILAIRHSDGRRFAVALSGALTPEHPDSGSICTLMKATAEVGVIPINELLIRTNLPAATREVVGQLGL